MKSLLPFDLRLRALFAACVVLAVGQFVVTLPASSQDQSAAAPSDTIFARKILMDSVGRNMDDLEGMATSGKIDLAEGRDHADIVSVMLMVFPHLFPPKTNQWQAKAERDPGRDTFAAPEVWANFADFYARSGAASKIAYRASRTESADEFKRLIAELRGACDSCHGVYLKSN